MGPQEGINKQAVAEKEQERMLFLRFSRTNVLFFSSFQNTASLQVQSKCVCLKRQTKFSAIFSHVARKKKVVNCQWQKPQLGQQLQTVVHSGHLQALHASVSMSLSTKCVLCLFSSQPPVLLSANAHSLIIAMCVSNCLVCSRDAPSNFNQVLNNGALECVQPSMSAYHICPFTTRGLCRI